MNKTRSTILSIHRWLGITFGVLIFIICITGFLMLFSPSDHDGGMNAFFQAVKNCHRFLFIVPENTHGGMSLGRFLMGTTAIVMTLMLLTGVYLWWPKSKQMLKNRLKVSTTKGLRRFVYDSHVSLGIYAVVFLLFMSLTGPSWSFGWYKKATVTVLGGEPEPGFSKMPPMKDIKEHPGMPPMEEAKPTGKGHHGQGHFDGPGPMQDGKKPAQAYIVEFHTGRWAGTFSRILYGIAVLIGASLPLSGYYMWWRRKHPKKTTTR